MITGFLFFSKLIDGRTGNIDWGRLYVSRLLRLVPLYFFAMFMLFLMVVVATHGILNEPILQIVKGAIRWLGFTVLGNPVLNGFPHTSTIVAGVTWSLPYEWFFYFSLPLLALTVGVKAPLPYLILSVVATIGFVLWQPDVHHVLSFAGGITAAFLVRSEPFRRFAATSLASIICIGCLVVTVVIYPTAYSQIPLILLSTAFIVIACGNNLFGLLIHPISRTLGEMAYSIYLLHGLTLFAVFHILVGTGSAAVYSPIIHWLLVVAITPILILSSFITFQIIESPAMQETKAVTIWIRTRLFAIAKSAGTSH
jgi:peptidoglycan/LPS O-acetylase OafA/YrhL